MRIKEPGFKYIAIAALSAGLFAGVFAPFSAETAYAKESFGSETGYVGGGYAATGQISDIGYTSELYDASKGILTSGTMCVMSASDGYIWTGGYDAVMHYDGGSFARMDPSNGLTNARTIFEDSSGRIWVGTNDNGVVMIDGREQTHYTWEDGLPSSSIRSFAEDAQGTIYIGTTSGIAYVSKTGSLFVLNDLNINTEKILRLSADQSGTVYGVTGNGIIFALQEGRITKSYGSEGLGTAKVTCILADPERSGYVYIGTEKSMLFYGRFGEKAKRMKAISVSPLDKIQWLSYECKRIWVTSVDKIGYLDENGKFNELSHFAADSGIEMLTSDYQGIRGE